MDTPLVLPKRLRLIGAVAVLVAIFYAVCCTIYNAPASPAQIRIAGFTQRVLNPYFQQTWTLFGPTPGTSNNILLLYVRVQTPHGIVSEAPVNIEAAIDRLPRSDRLLPSKLPGVVLDFQETFSNYENLLYKTRTKAPVAQRALIEKVLRAQFGPEFVELQRLMSLEALNYFHGADVVQVRAVFADQAMTPFSERYERNPPVAEPRLLLNSGWMAFVPGVAA